MSNPPALSNTTAPTPSPARPAPIFAASPAIERNRVVGAMHAAAFIGISLPHFRRLYRAGRVPAGIRIGERKLGWRIGTLLDLLDSRDAQKAA